MSSETETDVFAPGLSMAPSFTGKMSDYDQWRIDAKVWAHGARMSKDQKGARLYNGQTNKHVKKVMLGVGLDVIMSSEGFDNILTVMDKKFEQKSSTKGTDAFDRFDDISRTKDEDTEEYLLRFETTYGDVQRADPGVKISERALTMLMIKRMRISKLNRALILGKMNDEMTTSSLSQTILELFPGGLPWEDIMPKGPKALSRSVTNDGMHDDTALMNDELMNSDHGHDEHDDAALIAKGKGKGGKHHTITCERCLIPGHEAKNCKISWDKCQLNHAKKSKFTDIASVAFACTHCGHPDCEGQDHEDDSDGWSVASSSDDDHDDIYFEPND